MSESLSVGSVQLGLRALDGLQVDALVLMPFKDERPLKAAAGFCDWRLNGRVSTLFESGWYEARPRDVLMMDTCGRIGSKWVFLFGQGQRYGMDLTTFRRRVKRMLETVKKADMHSLALELPGVDPGPLSAPEALAVFLDEARQIFRGKRITLLSPFPRFTEFIQQVAADLDDVALQSSD